MMSGQVIAANNSSLAPSSVVKGGLLGVLSTVVLMESNSLMAFLAVSAGALAMLGKAAEPNATSGKLSYLGGFIGYMLLIAAGQHSDQPNMPYHEAPAEKILTTDAKSDLKLPAGTQFSVVASKDGVGYQTALPNGMTLKETVSPQHGQRISVSIPLTRKTL